MAFYETESFGPLCGLITVEDKNQVIDIAEQAMYGLSAAILSNNHCKALKLAESTYIGRLIHEVKAATALLRISGNCWEKMAACFVSRLLMRKVSVDI